MFITDQTHIDVTLAGRFWFELSQLIHGYLYGSGKHGSPINLCKAGRLLVIKSCIARTTSNYMHNEEVIDEWHFV